LVNNRILTAAVTFIPSTTAVVVLVVAHAITYITSPRSALSCAFLLLGVQTLTHCTIIVLPFFLAATVPAIPIACTVVVSVVAEFISLKFGRSTITCFFGAFFQIGLGLAIFALALGTERCCFNFRWAAAIAFVPVATGIVVDVIARSITNVCVATFSLDCFARTFIFLFLPFTV